MNFKFKVLVPILVVWATTALSAQQLGDFEPKDDTFGLGKLKPDNKRVFISNFFVHFQLYNEKEKTSKGGALFRDKGVRGDATAELMVGLGNLTETDFQTATNRIYEDFLSQLQAKGFELIPADEAGMTATYKDWVKAAGPKVRVSEMPGMITAYPEGFSYFFQEKSKVGKAIGQKFAALDQTPQNLSKDLNDAIVINVDLFVFFMKDSYAFQGNAANIKIKTQLSLVANEVVSAKSDDKGLLFRKQQEYVTGSNTIQFVCGKYKMGGSATSVYTGTLKKDFIVGGVLDEKKIQSYAKGAVDFVGTENYFGTFYSAENKKSNNTTIIDVDTQKYVDGISAAGKKFLDFHLNNFVESIN